MYENKSSAATFISILCATYLVFTQLALEPRQSPVERMCVVLLTRRVRPLDDDIVFVVDKKTLVLSWPRS